MSLKSFINCPGRVLSCPVTLITFLSARLLQSWEGWKVLGSALIESFQLPPVFPRLHLKSQSAVVSDLLALLAFPWLPSTTTTPLAVYSSLRNTHNECIKASVGLLSSVLVYAPLMHSSIPPSRRPSPSFSIKADWMGSSYLLLWICRNLLSIRQALGKMVAGAPHFA